MTATASVAGSDISSGKTFELSEDITDEFVAKILADADANRAADEMELLRIEATNRAKSLINRAEAKLSQGSNAKLSEAVAALGLALASDDSDSIREKSDLLERELSVASLFGFDPNLANFFGTPNPPRTDRKPGSVGRAAPRQERLTPQPHAQTLGKIFGGMSFTLDPQLCFVLMPFAEKFQALYDDNIKPTVMRAELRCERADDIHGTTLITWDIWERINRARFLIAELTDQNSNVFYELGLAHALSKDAILITQSMDFVPFDLKTIRCIVYDYTPRGIQRFEKDLGATIAAIMKSA